MTERQITDTLLANGVEKFGVCDVNEIVFDENLRKYCESNSCGAFGRNYACPPFCGSKEQLVKKVQGFKRAVVYQTVSPLLDSFDVEGMYEAGKRHTELHLKIRKELDNCFSLAAGGCRICPECAAIKKEPCRHPDDVIISLEACCINVSELAATVGLKYINGANTVTYFSAFFI